MQRMESLYSNKFSNFGNLEDHKATNLNPMSPFKYITRNIVMGRTDNPGPQFNTSLTPNELVK